MNVSDIMAEKVLSMGLEDTVSKALKDMYDNNINQLPVTDTGGKYVGMIFAKEFLNLNAQPSSKLKHFAKKTPVLSPNDTVEKCTQLIVTTGNRALPVVEKAGLVGIVSETDLALTANFGHARVDEVMSGAIVIEESSTIANALTKMRRYNISRLPIIKANGLLTGIINALEIAKILSAPRERMGKASRGVSSPTHPRDTTVREIMRRAESVERGTSLNTLIDNFKKNEEIVVVGDKRPIGIVTPRDALEITLPKSRNPSIHVAHIEGEARDTIQEQLSRFLKKIQGKLENVQSVIVYADKHKSRKYSVRARIITAKGVIDAQAVGYDPLSAVKELISKLDRRIRSEHSQKVREKHHPRGSDKSFAKAME
jgi:CBS domain-containing protein/ribosome-associated translation inhibitor RaiA